MPLYKKDETFPERAVMVILVGTPFSYKTSLAITAKNPINFDLEKGSERAHGRAETYRINESWKEVEDDLAAGLLTPFNSAIVDTGGSLVDDYLWDYGRVIKYTKNDMQNWGTVKDLFKKFITKLRGSGLDVVVISHEKSKDKNDETVYDLDISGGGKQLLLRQADQIGFISKKDFKEGGQVVTKTILTFWPTASLPFCKNVAAIPDIVLPDCKSKEWEGFLDRMVIQPTRKAIVEMSEEQKNALVYIEEWRTTIDSIVPFTEEAGYPKTDEILQQVLKAISEIPVEHIKLQVRTYFSAHLKTIGWAWNKAANKFLPAAAAPVVTPAKAVEEKKEEAPATVPPVVETPPVEAEQVAPVEDKPQEEPPVEEIDLVKEAEAQRAAIKIPEPTGPRITPNPYMPPPTNDLFAKVEGK